MTAAELERVPLRLRADLVALLEALEALWDADVSPIPVTSRDLWLLDVGMSCSRGELMPRHLPTDARYQPGSPVLFTWRDTPLLHVDSPG